MYHLVIVNYNNVTMHLTRGYCEGSKALDGNDSEENGDVNSECEEGEGTDCEDLDCDTGEGK